MLSRSIVTKSPWRKEGEAEEEEEKASFNKAGNFPIKVGYHPGCSSKPK